MLASDAERAQLAALVAAATAAAAASVPRVAYTLDEAATALGVSRDSFDRWVRGELRLVRRGRIVLVPARELERWLQSNATKVGNDMPRSIRQQA